MEAAHTKFLKHILWITK